MNGETEQIEKQLRTIKIIAIAMLVGAPIVYLVIASGMNMQGPPEGTPENLIVYLLLMVAIGSPALIPVIVRSQIQTFRSNQNHQKSKMTPANLFFTISIIGIAFVEAVYIYGLVSFLLTGEMVNMLYFYPVGIVWSFVHWPKREKYNQLMERLNCP